MVLYAYTSGRAHESFRRAEQFDDSTVRNRADEVCAALFTATDKLALAEFAVVSDRVAAENEAIGDLIRDFGDLDQSVLTDDKPALQWLGDWKSLVTRRTEYAAALRDDPLARRPALPLTDGYPISRRMSSLHDGCAVPISVLDDFEISPFRDLEECTYAIELHICATPDGAVFIDGLTPHSEAEVWVRFGDAVSRSTQTADSVGRIELIGVRLGNGTVVAVDAVIEEFRGVVMAA